MPSRVPRKKRPDQRYAGYDSKFEYDLHNSILSTWDHHVGSLEYQVTKKYHPDFSKTINGITYLVEAKGRFWDFDEYSKYLWVREALPVDHKLVFIFSNASLPMPRAKVRQDGTKRSHQEWAEDNGFEWYEISTFPEEFT